MTKLIVPLALLLVLIGCKKESEYVLLNDSLRKIEFFDNGQTKSVMHFNLDTVLDGKTIYYYPNGTLARKLNYANGKLLGYDSIFYESGNIKYHQQWYDSILVHDTYLYYDTLIPSLIEIDGDTTIINYPRVKTYGYFNGTGGSGFDAEYSLEGNFIQSGGNPIVSVYLDTLSQFDFTFVAVAPPFFEGKFVIQEKNLSKNSIVSFKEARIDAGLVSYNFDPMKGIDDEFEILAVYSLAYDIDEIVLSDTIILRMKSRKITMSRPSKPSNMTLAL